VSFDLYQGTNGIQKQTYSFIAASQVESFSGDINDFLTYLVKNQQFDDSQYLVSLGAGTEA
jgi:xyloglucan-specific endo-beta-1,4-glucanase